MTLFGREDPGVLSQTGSCSGALFALAFLFSAFAAQDPAEAPRVVGEEPSASILTVVSERRADQGFGQARLRL